MRYLAKILSLIPTTAVQSALKSAVVLALHSVRQGSQSVLQTVPQQHSLCQGWVCQLLAPRVEESGDPAPAVSRRSCAGPQVGRDSVAPSSPAGPGQQSHSTATRSRPGKGICFPELKQYYVLGITEE